MLRKIVNMVCFNPRTHVGCDNITPFKRGRRQRFQSTHPRRVRQLYHIEIYQKWRFQSTHPRRVRPAQGTGDSATGEFQSTHPRRVRPSCRESQQRAMCFNPRTHVGCDLGLHQLTACHLVFQSTHPRRVRLLNPCYSSSHSVFQSTHPRRVRHSKSICRSKDMEFQSTHPRRVRLSSGSS